jgi:hypothetical protein
MKCEMKREMLFVGIVIWLILALVIVYATPIAPTINNISVSTMGAAGSAGGLVNYSGNGTHAGGYIFTLQISSLIQNRRWKGFVGTVTGRLTLDDGDGYTIFDWDQYSGQVGGEIYATRSAAIVNWSNINCTWGYLNTSNKTVLENENVAMFLNSSSDNITRTFNDTLHPQLSIAGDVIPANSCFSTKTYIHDRKNTSLDTFTEILLYDGSNSANGKIIFATIIDSLSQYGYRNDTNYSFQMILPENGSTSAAGVTPYYFYVELE